MIKSRANIARDQAKLTYQQKDAAEERQKELIKNFSRDLFNESDADHSHALDSKEVKHLCSRLKKTMNITINFDDELKEGDLFRYQMIEKIEELAEKKLKLKKIEHKEHYEKQVKSIDEKFLSECEGVVKAEEKKSVVHI